MLAIIVALAALAAPSLSGTLDGYRLRKAADLIRAEWARARNDALETGRIHVFRYELNGGQYRSEPWSAADDAVEGSGATAPAGRSSAAPSDLSGGRQLPDGIVFASGETASDVRATAIDPQAAGGSRGAGQGRPIVFYPDGTSSTGRVILSNERGKFLAIDLRGLTGIAQVSDVLAQEEASR